MNCSAFFRQVPVASGKGKSGENALFLGLMVGLFFLHAAYVFQYRCGADETQHLHVVWGWAHGLRQYQDVFDNHAPLFHLLFTPVFAAIGETPRVVLLMRLAMLPVYGLALWSLYALGRALFSGRVGCWAVVWTGFLPASLLGLLECHPDTLWTALWL